MRSVRPMCKTSCSYDVAIASRLHRDQGFLGRCIGGACRPGNVIWRRLDHRRRAQGHRERGGRVALRSGAREFAGVARLRDRRHHHVPDCRADRHALDGDFRRADDRAWPRHFHARTAVAVVDRPWTVHRHGRDRRHQCAAIRLCQPLVRPPARLGAGADFERHLSRRHDLAADLRGRHRRIRLAEFDAAVRARRDPGRGADRGDLFFARHPTPVIR